MKRLLSMAMLLSTLSCSGEEPQIDQEPPQIEIESPVEMGTYPAGEALAISVVITENLELHTYRVQIEHPASKFTFNLEEQHTHVQEVRFLREFTLPPAKGSTYELVVQADDHEGNLQEVRRTFRTAP